MKEYYYHASLRCDDVKGYSGLVTYGKKNDSGQELSTTVALSFSISKSTKAMKVPTSSSSSAGLYTVAKQKKDDEDRETDDETWKLNTQQKRTRSKRKRTVLLKGHIETKKSIGKIKRKTILSLKVYEEMENFTERNKLFPESDDAYSLVNVQKSKCMCRPKQKIDLYLLTVLLVIDSFLGLSCR